MHIPIKKAMNKRDIKRKLSFGQKVWLKKVEQKCVSK